MANDLQLQTDGAIDALENLKRDFENRVENAISEKEQEFAQIDQELTKCKEQLKEANSNIKELNRDKTAKNEIIAKEKKKFTSLKVDYEYLIKKMENAEKDKKARVRADNERAIEMEKLYKEKERI